MGCVVCPWLGWVLCVHDLFFWVYPGCWWVVLCVHNFGVLWCASIIWMGCVACPWLGCLGGLCVHDYFGLCCVSMNCGGFESVIWFTYLVNINRCGSMICARFFSLLDGTVYGNRWNVRRSVGQVFCVCVKWFDVGLCCVPCCMWVGFPFCVSVLGFPWLVGVFYPCV